jgi:hypothetical protein
MKPFGLYPRRHFIHGHMLFHRNGCDECSNLKVAQGTERYLLSLGQPKATIKDSDGSRENGCAGEASDVSGVAEN